MQQSALDDFYFHRIDRLIIRPHHPVKHGAGVGTLFNEPKKQYFYTRDNLGEVNSYGARYFLGIRGKF